MRRNRADTGTITGIAEVTAERVMLSGELLKSMTEAMARRDKIEQRFRSAVIHKLARMEAVLALVHVSHIARDQRPFDYYEDKFMEDSRAAEEWISRRSDESGLAAVKYIYGEGEEASAKPKKRRKWSDSPQYEI
jgi:hypothetical protein